MQSQHTPTLGYAHEENEGYDIPILISVAVAIAVLATGYLLLAWSYGWALPVVVQNVSPTAATHIGALLALIGLVSNTANLAICIFRISVAKHRLKIWVCAVISLVAIAWCVVDFVRRA
jgi:hypothetical protein